jgi:hypothetical protein
MNFTEEIAQVYCVAVADDNQLGDNRLFFHIEFKEPLSKEIRLQKYILEIKKR